MAVWCWKILPKQTRVHTSLHSTIHIHLHLRNFISFLLGRTNSQSVCFKIHYYFKGYMGVFLVPLAQKIDGKRINENLVKNLWVWVFPIRFVLLCVFSMYTRRTEMRTIVLACLFQVSVNFKVDLFSVVSYSPHCAVLKHFLLEK